MNADYCRIRVKVLIQDVMMKEQYKNLAAAALLCAFGSCNPHVHAAEASARGEILTFGVNGKRNHAL